MEITTKVAKNALQASNALGDKFKVGDEVYVKGDKSNRKHKVTFVFADGSVELDNGGVMSDFKPMFLTRANAASASASTDTFPLTSKNPIVQNALNATTKTYDPNRRPSVIVGEINRKCPKLSAKVDAWFVWVEFRDKKGVKGRLPDAIMAEPGFPRDKLEVARVDADGVLFTVKGNPYVNAAKFKEQDIVWFGHRRGYVAEVIGADKPNPKYRFKSYTGGSYVVDGSDLSKDKPRNAANAKAYDRNGHGLKEGDAIDTPKGIAVIVQFKQSTSNPERRYASYVGVSYDPEKKVVQEWLMTDSRGGIRATVQNAKFAVTSKSGASVVIEAPNYAAAEKEAKRRFGAGCVVDLVGNSTTKNA